MTLHYRASVSAGDGTDFVISDGSLDRHGTRINPRGWDLSAFKRNPIALFGHSGGFPIGKWENVRVEGDKVLGRLVLAAEGTSARIDELRKLVEQKILRAVSVGFSVLEWGSPGKSEYDIEKQSLHEVSLVSVGSNVNALAAARALNISESTIRMAFGEHAEGGRRVVSTSGEHADTTTATERRSRVTPLARPKVNDMKTISQRVEEVQTSLGDKKVRLADLQNADQRDHDAIETLLDEIEFEERDLALLKRSEGKAARSVAAPAVARTPLGFPAQKLSGLDLLVRRAVVHGCAIHTGRGIDQVLEQHYPVRDEATEMAVMKRTDAPLGTTTTSGFASQLVQSTWASFLDALRGKSVYPVLRDRGYGISFDSAGTAYLPQLTGGGANGSFFAEGSPIRVGRVTVSAPTFTARKMGVIIPFTREAARRSTPQLETVVRRAIVDDTAATLDPLILDATAGDTIRPAGILNGVSATASGYGGGDHTAVKEDFKALLAPFIAANAVDNITVVMNPAQGLAISMMDGPDNNTSWFAGIASRVNIVESTHATSGRLIALRNTDFATALGDMPEFEMSNQATIHMEDTTPLEIVESASPDVVAAPVRSFWQTDSMGIRMIMDVSWVMARSGMVGWIDGTSY